MKFLLSFIPSVICYAASTPLAVLAAAPAAFETKGLLLFADDFNRADTSPTKDGLANGWDSNSERRASGQKQAFLADGVLTVITAPGADHNAVIFHAIEPSFHDGAIQIRARLQGDESFSVDFNNPECASVHSGHIINVAFGAKGITLKDSKTGAMDLAIRARNLAKEKSPELSALLKSKSKLIAVKLADDQWHELTMIKQGDTLNILVDGKRVGDFESAGFTHPTINKMSISAKNSPQLDDLKIWSLR
jgi:hypothetical protein